MEYTTQLKPPSAALRPFLGRSDILVRTDVPSGLCARGQYLKAPTSSPPPVISSSPFIPPSLIEHLMRRKKNSALGVKFKALSGADEITNMEGALHTFVTPVSLSFLHGDYRYGVGHGMVRFPDAKIESGGKKVQQARQVIISAGVQPDFEGRLVMLQACSIGESALEGRPLPVDFKVLDVKTKQDDEKRDAYDKTLRSHMIYHLTQAHRLPGLFEAAAKVVESPAAMNFLEQQISAPDTDYTAIFATYIKLPNGATISLEMLFNTALQQLRNEISALEALCPHGYVLTIDPPSIFAQQIGATLLNRIQFAALKWLANGGDWFANMKAFAFNDYADRGAVRLLEFALERQGHVQVVTKASLFPAPENLYKALSGTEGAFLVVHNNSDAFGQNIETEWESGSMDGAIGANSSAAASLFRSRKDLVETLM